jgi:hypothetical protein
MDTQTTAPQTAADRTPGQVQDSTQAVKSVAATASQEAGRTTREASDQARQLWSQTRTELTDQAGAQQARAASGLRDLAQQLGSMAQQSDQDGMARSLVDDVARRAGDAATWLDQRDPGTLLQDVRDVARRRPGMFLAVAAGVGVVAGRLSRSLAAEANEGSSAQSAGSAGQETSVNPGTPVAVVGTDAGTRTAGLSTGAGGELRRTTQPVEPDGSLSPIGSDGLLAGPEDQSTRERR